MLQLLNRQFLAVLLQFLELLAATHRKPVSIRTQLRPGIFHQLSRPITQLNAFFSDLQSGIFSGPGGQQQHRDSACQSADQHPGQNACYIIRVVFVDHLCFSFVKYS